MLTLGQMIKRKREDAGLSQKKLGEACGLSDSEILKIENGTRKKPNWDNLCKISRALEFHPFDLLLAAGYITEDDINPSIRVKHLECLTKEECDLVQTFIDFLLFKQKNDSNPKEG